VNVEVGPDQVRAAYQSGDEQARNTGDSAVAALEAAGAMVVEGHVILLSE
jgi:hypothetical protein